MNASVQLRNSGTRISSDQFWPVDAERILQIPLQYNAFDDFVAWNFTKSGYFSVRLAYHCEWMHQYGGRASRAMQGTSRPNPVWGILWKLNVPAKIKKIGWRLLHGLIPVRAVLANHHIGTNGICPLCKQGPEDTVHLLFSCVQARDVWLKLGLSELLLMLVQLTDMGHL